MAFPKARGPTQSSARFNDGKKTNWICFIFIWGGSHGELMLVIKILGIFRCIFPVVKAGRLEANVGLKTSQLQLVVTKEENGLLTAMPSDFLNTLGTLKKKHIGDHVFFFF